MVLEATGGLEMPAAAALALAGLEVAIVNPRRVRDAAIGVGRLAKTDELDAQALAHYAEAVRPEPKPLPDAQAEEFGALLARRRQVVGILTAEKNRLHSSVGRVRAHVEAHIAWLEGQQRRAGPGAVPRRAWQPPVAGACRAAAERARKWAGCSPPRCWLTCPSCANKGHGKIAALAGVAPLNRDKGQAARHPCRVGRGAALYMGERAGVR